jgi:hypothetical protein
MFFVDADPSPLVKGMGREAPGERPMPEGLRAWWWPDGTTEPAEPREGGAGPAGGR